MSPDKVFVIVRRDLSQQQQAVQSIHAVVELVLWHADEDLLQIWADDHKTVVLCGVEDEAELRWWKQRLEDADVWFGYFEEPDMGGELTAIAVHPHCDQRLLKELELL